MTLALNLKLNSESTFTEKPSFLWGGVPGSPSGCCSRRACGHLPAASRRRSASADREGFLQRANTSWSGSSLNPSNQSALELPVLCCIHLVSGLQKHTHTHLRNAVWLKLRLPVTARFKSLSRLLNISVTVNDFDSDARVSASWCWWLMMANTFHLFKYGGPNASNTDTIILITNHPAVYTAALLFVPQEVSLTFKHQFVLVIWHLCSCKCAPYTPVMMLSKPSVCICKTDHLPHGLLLRSVIYKQSELRPLTAHTWFLKSSYFEQSVFLYKHEAHHVFSGKHRKLRCSSASHIHLF